MKPLTQEAEIQAMARQVLAVAQTPNLQRIYFPFGRVMRWGVVLWLANRGVMLPWAIHRWFAR